MGSLSTFDDDLNEHFLVSFKTTFLQFLAEVDKKLDLEIEKKYESMDNDKIREILVSFHENVEPHESLIVAKDSSFFEIYANYLFPEISLEMLHSMYTSQKAKDALWKYLQLFLFLSKQYLGKENNEALLKQLQMKTPKKKGRAHSASSSSSSRSNASPLGNMFDIENLKNDPFLKKLEESKLAQMVKNFAKEIDFSEFAGLLNAPVSASASASPNVSEKRSSQPQQSQPNMQIPLETMFKSLNDNPSILQNMMSKMSNIVQEQLKNEDLTGDNLKEEVENILGSLKQSPVVNTIVESIGGATGAAGAKNPLSLLKSIMKGSTTAAGKSGANREVSGNDLQMEDIEKLEKDLESMWSQEPVD